MFVRVRDRTDYAHRHFVNLAAAAMLLAVAIAIIWTVRTIEEHEKTLRCLNSGRRDCIEIPSAPPRYGVRTTVR